MHRHLLALLDRTQRKLPRCNLVVSTRFAQNQEFSKMVVLRALLNFKIGTRYVGVCQHCLYLIYIDLCISRTAIFGVIVPNMVGQVQTVFSWTGFA